MAVLGMFLAAHHRDAVAVDATGEPLDPGLEPLRLSDPVVPDVTLIVVEPLFGRAPAELVAEEHVANAGSGELTLEGRSVVLRRVPRPRNGTNIGDDADLMLSEQFDEVLARMVRVAERVQLSTRLPRSGGRVHVRHAISVRGPVPSTRQPAHRGVTAAGAPARARATPCRRLGRPARRATRRRRWPALRHCPGSCASAPHAPAMTPAV